MSSPCLPAPCAGEKETLFQRVALLSGRADWTPDAFHAHWRGPHAELALRLPALAGYTQNRVRRTLCKTARASVPDGIAQVWTSRAASASAASAATAAGQAVLEDELRFLRAFDLLDVGGGSLPDDDDGHLGGIKLMGAGRMASGGDGQAFLSALARLDVFAHGRARARMHQVVSVRGRPQLDRHADPPALWLCLWLQPGVDAEASGVVQCWSHAFSAGWLAQVQACAIPLQGHAKSGMP